MLFSDLQPDLRQNSGRSVFRLTLCGLGALMVGRMFDAQWMLREMLITARYGTILRETFPNTAITKCAVKLGRRRSRN